MTTDTFEDRDEYMAVEDLNDLPALDFHRPRQGSLPGPLGNTTIQELRRYPLDSQRSSEYRVNSLLLFEYL